MTFPGGTFAADPASNIGIPENVVSTGTFTFDRAVSHWLPVPREAVTPDGSRYAYSDKSGVVHIVDLTSASASALTLDPAAIHPDERWVVLDYSDEGIYLRAVPKVGGFPRGLWLADPASGGVRQLSDHGFWQLVDSAIAWGSAASPAGGGDANRGDSLLRLESQTGAQATWFGRPGMQLVVLGLDGDHPLVMTTAPTVTEVWTVSGPGAAQKVYSGPGQVSPAALHITGSGVKDDRGLWLGSPEGLLLYSSGAGFKRMSTSAGTVAGPCF